MTHPLSERLALPVLLTAFAAAASAQTSTAPATETGPVPIEGWQRLGPLPGASPTFTRAQNSSATPDVVIGSTFAGIVRSEDGGVSWSHVSPWPGSIRNYGLATVSDTDPDRLIAQSFFFGTFTSSDGGATWSPSAVSPATEYVLDVRFAPSCGPIAFARGLDSTLWRTADHGEHWHAFYDALDPVSDFAVMPGNPLLVVLATSSMLHVTRDGGITWTVHPYPTGSTLAIELDPHDGQAIHVGTGQSIHTTTDDGATWTSNTVGFEIVDAIHVDRSAPGRVFAALRGQGLLRSDDGGSTWTNVTTNGPPMSTNVVSIDTDAARPGRVLVSDPGGLYRSIDGGVTFQRESSGLAEYATIDGIAPDPFDPDRAVARTGASVFHTSDGGATWTEGAVAGPMFGFHLIADPTTAGRFYMADGYYGLQRSDDGGATFQWTLNDATQWKWSYAAHPTDADVVFGAGRGLRRSDDGGLTYGPNLVPSNWVWSVDVSPVDPDRVFCSSSVGIHRSLDGGVTFELATQPPLPIVRDLRADAVDPDVVWAASPFSGVFRSDDAGLTWHELPFASPYYSAIAPLSGGGRLGGGVMAGAYDLEGVSLSVDGGRTNGTMAGDIPSSVTVIREGSGAVWAGTAGAGVWRFDR